MLRHAENIPSIHECATNEINQKKLGKNKETDLKLKDGRNESGKVDLILGRIESLYGRY